MPTFQLCYSPDSDMSASPDAMDIDSPSYTKSFRKRTFDQIASPEEIHHEQAVVNTERAIAKEELTTKSKFLAIYRSLKSILSRAFFSSPPATDTPEYRHVHAKRQRISMPGEWPASPLVSPVKRTKVPVTKRFNKSPLSSPVPIHLPSSTIHTESSGQTNARAISSPVPTSITNIVVSENTESDNNHIASEASTEHPSRTNAPVESSPSSTHTSNAKKNTASRPQTRGYQRRYRKHPIITNMIQSMMQVREQALRALEEEDKEGENKPDDNQPTKETKSSQKPLQTSQQTSKNSPKPARLAQMERRTRHKDVNVAPTQSVTPRKDSGMTQKVVTNVPIPAASTSNPESRTVTPTTGPRSILVTRSDGTRSLSAPPKARKVHFGGESSFFPGEIFPTGTRQFVKESNCNSEFPYGYDEYAIHRASHDNAFGNSVNSIASELDTPRRSTQQQIIITPSKPIVPGAFTPTPLRELTQKFDDFHLHKYKAERRREAVNFQSEVERVRLEEEKAAARKVEKLVKKVDQNWDSQIDKVTSIKDHYRQVTPRLTRKDFGTLLPTHANDGNGWLNDAVIGEYLANVVAKINDKAGWKKTDERGPPAQVLASHLFTTYQQKGYQGVARWASRAKVGGAKMLDCETLLLPINRGSHWTLLCVSGTKRSITYLDSLGGAGTQMLSWARRYVAEELGELFVESEWTCSTAVAQQQHNALDCGVFVCLNGHALLDSREPARMFVGEEVAGLGRRWVAGVLLGMEW